MSTRPTRTIFGPMAIGAIAIAFLCYIPAIAQEPQSDQKPKPTPGSGTITMIVPALPKSLWGCWTMRDPLEGEPSKMLEVRSTRVVLDGVEGFVFSSRVVGKNAVETKITSMKTREKLITRLELGNGANQANTGELLVSDGNAVTRIYERCKVAAS